MRPILTLIVALLCLSFSVTKNRKFMPPGTVQVNDTLFADEFEVSNFAWHEFEVWISSKYGIRSKEHLAVLPDTTVWRQGNSYNEPYVQYYYRHPAYKNYPVVGVSFEQALKYCKWRTERVKEMYAIGNKHMNIELSYKLPSIKEWEDLTFNGQSEFSSDGKDKKGYMKMNVRRETQKKYEDDVIYDSGGVDVTAPVNAYKPNVYKIYNLIGNVAEMTNEYGVAKGGGWINLLEECRVGKQQNYTLPNAWLGFRCVCIIKKKASEL